MINAKLISVPFTCNGTALCITICILFSYSLWRCFIHMGIFLARIPLPLLPWTWCADMNARLFDHRIAWLLCPFGIRSSHIAKENIACNVLMFKGESVLSPCGSSAATDIVFEKIKFFLQHSTQCRKWHLIDK